MREGVERRRQTDRQTDRQTETETVTETETETETDRQTDKERHIASQPDRDRECVWVRLRA